MKWQDERRSDNVEDRRGSGFTGGGIKIGGFGILLVLVISLVTGQNPLKLLSLLSGGQDAQVGTPQTQTPAPPGSEGYDEQKDFVSAVLASTEDVWTEVFTQMNRQYEKPKLVLFSDQVQSACGLSSSAVGPFYCPMDRMVYLDLGFFQELDQRFGAPGDFAQAYVVAHEVGHHVQNLLGISDKVNAAQQRGSEEEANALSVKVELQADCFAGVWGFHTQTEKKLLDPGDLEEGLNAAAAVGDDRLQKEAGRSVSPESWTHGSSAMRVSWFKRGFQGGDINACNTFDSRQ